MHHSADACRAIASNWPPVGRAFLGAIPPSGRIVPERVMPGKAFLLILAAIAERYENVRDAALSHGPSISTLAARSPSAA